MKLTDEQIVQKLRQSVGNLGIRDPSEYSTTVTCSDLNDAADAIERLTKERSDANAAAEAHEVKWRSICKAERSDGGMCACSYDKTDDVCAFHSPKLAAAEARVAELEALLDVDRLTDIITDSIDLDWTPRTAAKAIVRAMGG
jgi:hypothetical protein